MGQARPKVNGLHLEGCRLVWVSCQRHASVQSGESPKSSWPISEPKVDVSFISFCVADSDPYADMIREDVPLIRWGGNRWGINSKGVGLKLTS